jgi:hypothetical protein
MPDTLVASEQKTDRSGTAQKVCGRVELKLISRLHDVTRSALSSAEL